MHKEQTMRFHAHSRTQPGSPSSNRRWRPGAVLNLALGAAAFVGIAALATVSATNALREVNGLPTSTVSHLDEGPTPQQVELELLRIGLDPETLACAGCTTEDVIALVADAQAHLETRYQGLREAQRDYEQAKFQRDRLKRLVRAGTASPEEVQQLAIAETTLATTAAARDALQGALFEAATEGLAPGEVTAIETIRGHDRWKFPTYYKAASRSHADSIALRDALANLRINPEYGLEVDPEAQTLVNAELEKPAVSTAKAAYDARYADLKQQWETSLGL